MVRDNTRILSCIIHGIPFFVGAAVVVAARLMSLFLTRRFLCPKLWSRIWVILLTYSEKRYTYCQTQLNRPKSFIQRSAAAPSEIFFCRYYCSHFFLLLLSWPPASIFHLHLLYYPCNLDVSVVDPQGLHCCYRIEIDR